VLSSPSFVHLTVYLFFLVFFLTLQQLKNMKLNSAQVGREPCFLPTCLGLPIRFEIIDVDAIKDKD
jgi:hypothetical protein